MVSAEGSSVYADVIFASGLISVTLPLFVGTLHGDPALNVWRNRPQPLVTEDRLEM